MSIKLNLNKEFSEGSKVIISLKKTGTIIINDCNGSRGFLVEDEKGKISYQSKTLIGRKFKSFGQYSTINCISKVLSVGDFIKLKYLKGQYISELIIRVSEITLDSYGNYDILYDYGYKVNRDGGIIKLESDYTVLSFYKTEEISFASQDEINILNNL